MTAEALKELDAELAELARRKARRKLSRYRPYPKQAEFHAAGAEHRERLLLGGNRCGKTLAGGAEVAMHLTGRYPDWWKGKRFGEPIVAWASGITSESTRDVPQEKLIGPPADRSSWGTGMIPGDALGPHSMARTVADALDQVIIKHVTGGQSILGFKTYEKGREKWQGAALHLIWYDEEPPVDIYNEGLARLSDNRGIALATMTPLLGMSEVVRGFIHQDVDEGEPELVDPPGWTEADDDPMGVKIPPKPLPSHYRVRRR